MTSVATPGLDNAPTTHARLLAWVQEMAELTTPDQVVWVDGSDEEWERLTQKLVDAGTFTRLTAKSKRRRQRDSLRQRRACVGIRLQWDWAVGRAVDVLHAVGDIGAAKIAAHGKPVGRCHLAVKKVTVARNRR